MELVKFHIVDYPPLGDARQVGVYEPVALPSGHIHYHLIFMSESQSHLDKWLSLFGTVDGLKHWKEVVQPSLGDYEYFSTVWEWLDTH